MSGTKRHVSPKVELVESLLFYLADQWRVAAVEKIWSNTEMRQKIFVFACDQLYPKSRILVNSVFKYIQFCEFDNCESFAMERASKCNVSWTQ